MSTTIVFIVIKNGEVINVAEDPSLAQVISQRHPGSVVDAWVLESRNVEDATMDEWLEGKKFEAISTNLNVGETVYFEDDVVRGIGKVVYNSGNKGDYIKIQVDDGNLYDKISRGISRGATPVYMNLEDVKGVIK